VWQGRAECRTFSCRGTILDCIAAVSSPSGTNCGVGYAPRPSKPHVRNNTYIYIPKKIKYICYLFIYLMIVCIAQIHVKWVPCHHFMARPRVAVGAGLQISKPAANILSRV
jgi:hypothetical protein